MFFFLLSVIGFVRHLWRRVAGQRNVRGPQEMQRALRQVERLIALRPSFDPDIVTIHPDQIVLEGDRTYEFVRCGDEWLQIPTDEDVAAMEERLWTSRWIDDRFLRTIQFHPSIAWDLEAVEEATMNAATKIARGTSRVLHALH